MLGWEFPPHIAGGLGTACHGLARALAAGGVEVLFVLPRALGDEDAGGVEIVGADTAAVSDADLPELLPVDAALQPYTTAAAYAPAAAVAEAPPVPRGRYGGDLFAEVARYARRVEELARTREFDVVHAHDWMSFPAGIAAARAAGVPLLVHVHSCEHDRSGPGADPRIVAIEQEGLDAADAVVCVSRYTAERLRTHYRTREPALRVVHNAAPPHAGRGDDARVVEDPVVLFLGRVTYQKGPGYFLEAAARVAAALPRAKFVIAGSGDLLPSTVERVAALGLARRVHFTGFLRGDDVSRAFDAADVYVMPSVSEPFGISPLEAVARGVPVIVSRQSGVAEVLPSALRADFWDVEDLADKILSVLRRPALGRTLAAGARREARELSWSRAARAVSALYEEFAG